MVVVHAETHAKRHRGARVRRLAWQGWLLAIGLVLWPLPSLAVVSDAQCDLRGSWTMRLSVPVKWSVNGGLDTGKGTMRFVALVQRQLAAEGHHYVDAVQLCARQVPEWRSLRLLSSEIYGPTHPPQAYLPSVSVPTEAQLALDTTTGVDGNATWRLSPLALSMGIAFADPARDLWPVEAERLGPLLTATSEHAPPGAPMDYAFDAQHLFLPVGPARHQRARTMWVAHRTVIEDGMLSGDCNQMAGEAQLASCRTVPTQCLREDGAACTRAEVGALGRITPNYRGRGPVRIKMARIADDAGCDEAEAYFRNR